MAHIGIRLQTQQNDPRFDIEPSSSSKPASALDPVMTGEMLEVIRELADEGQQIVLAKHEVSFARRVADWVVFLAAGKVVESAGAVAFF